MLYNIPLLRMIRWYQTGWNCYFTLQIPERFYCEGTRPIRGFFCCYAGRAPERSCDWRLLFYCEGTRMIMGLLFHYEDARQVRDFLLFCCEGTRQVVLLWAIHPPTHPPSSLWSLQEQPGHKLMAMCEPLAWKWPHQGHKWPLGDVYLTWGAATTSRGAIIRMSGQHLQGPHSHPNTLVFDTQNKHSTFRGHQSRGSEGQRSGGGGWGQLRVVKVVGGHGRCWSSAGLNMDT